MMMKPKDPENIFREKVESIKGLPPEVHWNAARGWEDYRRKYLLSYRRKIIYFLSSAAAILILLLFLIPGKFTSETRNQLVFNDMDSVKEIKLPDGNTVWLNRNSSIEYPRKFDKKQTSINIEGEAYIEISIVVSGEYALKANNALIKIENPCAFNIRARENDENVNITVSAGALKVTGEGYRESLALLVTEGNYCSVHKSENLVYSSVNLNQNYLAWKTGILYFKSTPIATVSDILSEYYQVDIKIEDKALAYCLFSGSFSQVSINNILDKIQNDLNIGIIYTDDRIIMSGQQCNKL